MNDGSLSQQRTRTRWWGPANSFTIWAVVVLLCASLARIAAYQVSSTWAGPDTFSYLNVARQLRGHFTPDGWDLIARLPRNDQGARTPGYPLFLNLIFRLDGHNPTDMTALRGPPELDEWHRRFLDTEENLRAVHRGQHVLGILASLLAYGIVHRWTRRPWLAAVTALAVVGLRPAWIFVYEPWVVTEILAATLLLACLWLVTLAEENQRDWRWPLAAATLAGLLVLVRPAFLPLPLLVVFGLIAIRTQKRLRAFLLLSIPCLLIIGGWMIRNGLTHRFWGVSSVQGVTMISHFKHDPASFDHPVVRSVAEESQGNRFLGLHIANALLSRSGLTFPEADKLLLQQTWRAAARTPHQFANSYLDALARAFYPAELAEYTTELRSHVLRIGTLARVIHPRFPRFVKIILGLLWLAVMLASVLVLLVRAPIAARLATAAALVSAVSVAVAANTENTRHAFPTQTAMLLTPAVLVEYSLRRRAALGRERASP